MSTPTQKTTTQKKTTQKTTTQETTTQETTTQETTTSTVDPALYNRLERFLHVGIEIPKYYPGCWASHKCFEVGKLPVLNEIFGDRPNSNESDNSELKNNTDVVDIILETYKGGLCTRFETIAFALAKCLLLGSPLVREEVYKAACEICVTPEQLMLFNNYTRLLKTGNGRGWCKSIKRWYYSREPMELAKEISRVRARYGRSHKTLLRKSHLNIPVIDPARNAVVKYAIYGLKRAKQLLSDQEGTEEIFSYIQTVEDMRHCEDPMAAALIAKRNFFTLDHIPGHLLTSQLVWNAIIPQFSLRQLLYNIQRIHNMGFLTNDSLTNAYLTTLLNSKDLIKKSNVTPIEVYITICNYKKSSRPLKYEKAKVVVEKEQRRRTRQVIDASTGVWEWTTIKRHPKEIKNWGIDKPPNPLVLAALHKLIDKTWLLTPPTKARYLITLDMRNHMFKGRHFCKNDLLPKKAKKVKSGSKAAKSATKAKATPAGDGDADNEKKSKKHLLAECFYNKHVTPGHAAIVLALQLLKRERDVKLAVFTEAGIQLVTIEPKFCNIEEAEFILRDLNLGRVQLDAPIEWAAKLNQKFDVFISMVDRSTRYMELEVEARGGRGPGGRFGPPPAPPAPGEPPLADHCPVRALYRYRKSSGVADAKLIVMNLASHRAATTDGSHEGVLDIVGVDEYVPKILDAFVLGQFK